MSLASDYAADVATQQVKVATAESSRPTDCLVGSQTVSVQPDGRLHISKEEIISPEDALKLGQWLVATFG